MGLGSVGVGPMGLGPAGAAMAGMYYLVFWERRSTATVVDATGAAQARRLATKQKKQGYGSITSAQKAVAADVGLIRKGSWVRRRRNGTSPQFGSAKQKQPLDACVVLIAVGCEGA